MKGIREIIRHYYKYNYEEWTSPLLDSNGIAGSDEFSVWGSHNQYSGQTWRAFHTNSGYSSGYYVGNYGNEYSTTMSIYMHTLNPTLINCYSLYSPTINSNSNWGSISSTRFYGSNDGVNWTQLYSTGNFGQDSQQTFTFENNTYYNYYQFQMTTYGSGHKDQSNVSSFSISGKIRNSVESTLSDYDYFVDKPEFKVVFENGIYKAIRF